MTHLRKRCGVSVPDAAAAWEFVVRLHAAPDTAGIERDEDADPESGAPRTFTRPTVIIWHSPTCQACQLSEEVFRAIERTPGFRVVRVPVRWDVMRQRYAHVISLPTYDVIWPGPAHVISPSYGPGTRLQTIRGGDHAALRRLFPEAFTGPGKNTQSAAASPPAM